MKINRENAAHYTWGNQCDGWHLVRNDILSVIREKMPPHTSEIRHYHGTSIQFFYILSGTATMEVDDEIIILNPGEGNEIRPGQPHQMFNHSNEDLEFIVISCPPSHGDRFVL